MNDSKSIGGDRSERAAATSTASANRLAVSADDVRGASARSRHPELEGSARILAEHVRGILGEIGEDPRREGLLDTPKRVAKALGFLTSGYQQDYREVLEKALFEEDYEEMILVKDIEVFSLCEHHMLPFFGRAHVAYIPRGRVVGLSKLPRVVDVFARRLQVQERLTVQIRDAVEEVVRPAGVAVVIEARHLCMVMRGVQKQNSITTTSAMSGDFLDNLSTREEFMRLIRGTD